jgi:hypothetical protein
MMVNILTINCLSKDNGPFASMGISIGLNAEVRFSVLIYEDFLKFHHISSYFHPYSGIATKRNL